MREVIGFWDVEVVKVARSGGQLVAWEKERAVTQRSLLG